MNAVGEMWSLRWHELQRRLAVSAADRNTSPREVLVPVNAHTVTWLARARAGSWTTHAQSHRARAVRSASRCY